MSIYITKEITRKEAIKMILRNIFDVDNEKLGELLFDMFGYDSDNNYKIIDD